MKQPAVMPEQMAVPVSMPGGFSLQVNGNIVTDEINRSQKLWDGELPG